MTTDSTFTQFPLQPAPQDDSVVEDFHGQSIHDPYRPLEDLDAEATTSWWRAHNRRTEAFLAQSAQAHQQAVAWHQMIRDYTREGMPVEYGGNYFFSRQAGLEPQPTYYVRVGSATAEPQILLDPNTLSDDGTVAISTLDQSPDGSLVAYTVSEAGSDWQIMRFRDVVTGQDVFEELTGLRFTGATWDVDGKGVIYMKPLPEDEANGSKHFASYHHTLGTPQSEDVQVYKRPDVENSFAYVYRLEDDDPVLFFGVQSGTNRETGVALKKPDSSELIEILKPGVAKLSPFYRDGDTLYATTDLDAPRSRVVKLTVTDPDTTHWQTVVAESSDPSVKLKSACVTDGKLLLFWSRQGADAVEVCTMDGQVLHEAPIPIGSTIAINQIRPKDKSFMMSIGGYLSPGTRYEYTIADNSLTFLKKSDIPRDLTEVAVVERLFATSKDGTQVPMWVIRPKSMLKDGSSATLLYGYGGFNVSLDPGFSYNIAHWVEHGGVYVVSNLRGGGELGKDWYDGGRLANKQNVFDDLVACAETLIQQGYTNPKRLAISGGSNGGLLTAATSQQRPDLFGAVISNVPVTDLLRFHTNNYGAAWMSDYGNPAKKEDFEASIQYSPLHNVADAKDKTYPPTLILTGDHDDRVAPWHAFKWAATRQAKGHEASTLLRVDERAGHGAGKPTQKVIEESADQYAFLVQTLGAL